MQTQAVVFVEVDHVDLRTIDMPAPGPGQVQIRTTYSTISAGTEGWGLRNLFTWQPTPFPCVPGYQGREQSDAALTAEAERIGFPLMVKAAAGGGGPMRTAASASRTCGAPASASEWTATVR